MANGRGGLSVGFVSTRFAGTDGVSLESAKWAEILSRHGHRSFWFAGELDRPEAESMLVPTAFFNYPEVAALQEKLFGTGRRDRATTDLIYEIKEFLKGRLYEFVDRFGIDLLIPQNALAIPMHVPLGLAIAELIAETEIPTIAHHHDFFWERPRFLLNAIGDILQAAFPPDLPSIEHVVINSMIQRELASRRGLSSSVAYNTLDFDAQREPFDEFNRDFREEFGFREDDILILQPTRVISRKGIEQAIYLVKRLELPHVKLLISHSAGDEGGDYLSWITDTARDQGIEIHLLYNRLNDTRKFTESGEKLYSLWDVYPHADLVTYPSLYEGFGNAFLEAVYFRKPLLVNRYSVYIVDIEPRGFDVIAIDGFLTNRAVVQVREVLENPERRKAMGDHNYEVARRFFSYDVTDQTLAAIIRRMFGSAVMW